MESEQFKRRDFYLPLAVSSQTQKKKKKKITPFSKKIIIGCGRARRSLLGSIPPNTTAPRPRLSLELSFQPKNTHTCAGRDF